MCVLRCFVESDAQDAALPIADIDTGRALQLLGPRRIARAALPRELEPRIPFAGLDLCAEDSGGGARRFGARYAALEHDDLGSRLGELEGARAPHHAAPYDDDIRPLRHVDSASLGS